MLIEKLILTEADNVSIYLTTLNTIETALSTIGPKIESILDPMDPTEAAKIAKIATKVKPLLADIAQLVKIGKIALSKYKEKSLEHFNDKTNKALVQLGNDLNNIKLDSTIDDLKTGIDTLNKTFVKNKFKELTDTLEKVIDEASGSNSNKTTARNWKDLFKKLLVDNARFVQVQDNKGIFRTCASDKALLNAYYEIELAPKLKLEPDKAIELFNALGTAFIEELLKLGFDEITNPFLAFVIKYYTLNGIDGNIIKAIPYNGVHNAFINGNITEKDLRGTGLLKEDNLIFNPELYKITEGELPSYLNIQKQALDNINRKENQEIKALNNNNPIDFIKALFYEEGNPIYGKAPTGKKPKSLTAINNLFKECFNVEATGLKQKHPLNISKIKSEITDAVQAKKIMCYMIYKFLDNQTSRNSKLVKFGLKDTDGPDFTDMLKLATVFDNVDELRGEDLDAALVEIADAGGAKIPDDARPEKA